MGKFGENPAVLWGDEPVLQHGRKQGSDCFGARTSGGKKNGKMNPG
jgi:hypothetical protein